MSRQSKIILFLSLGLSHLTVSAAQETKPALVPWPKQIAMKSGDLAIGPQSRIVVSGTKLMPLAKIVAGELHALGAPALDTATGNGRAGDICLVLDDALKDEAHSVEVTDRAVVRGGNYGAVALGTVTLLQSAAVKDGRASIPCMSVADEPASQYRGLMIDVARQQHSIAGLRQIVELCRLYKVRYLQLHLTDDQSFMFPSTAYPKLNTKNENHRKSYTLDELNGLVGYADARNVTIIPEYEMPGHSATANRAMHDLFIIAKTLPYEHHASINFCKDDVMKAVETIVGEMCDVFKSTPYFHIGGDEADLALADQNVDFKAAMKKYNLPNQHELYRRFVCQMDEIVKKHGKQMIVWEGFGRHGKVKIPKDIIVMPYEIRFYMPGDLVKDGYKIINASWTPLYVLTNNNRPPAEIYAWNIDQFKPYGAKPDDKGIVIQPTSNLIGAQMCSWEQTENMELPKERDRLPAMMERIWNPSAGKSFDDFQRRMKQCDRMLDLLLH